MDILFLLLLPLSVIFVLWLGAQILDKAGIEKKWVFCLLIPIVNIIMIWIFAFSSWNNVQKIDDR
jgi:hypothetical protein